MSEAPPAVFGHEREAAHACYVAMMDEGIFAEGDYSNPLLAVRAFVSRWLTDTYGPTGREDALFRYGVIMGYMERALGVRE